jgi:hypothetical protein
MMMMMMVLLLLRHVTFDDDAATSTELLAHATKCTWMKPKADTLPLSDLWKMMADHPTAKAKPELTTNGTTFITKSHCVYDACVFCTSCYQWFTC